LERAREYAVRIHAGRRFAGLRRKGIQHRQKEELLRREGSTSGNRRMEIRYYLE